MRRAFRIAIVFQAILLGAALSATAREPLSFEERVTAQEAIERVYYARRIWPKENPRPKPPFEEMVPRAEIEAKVTDYLKKCVALDRYWQRPIRPEQLQAEMERMAKGTKDPATLGELFAALNDDPYLIAECLARPALADRLLQNWYCSDTRFHAEAKAKAEKARAEITPETFEDYPEGECRRATFRIGSPEENSDSRMASGSEEAFLLDSIEFKRIRGDLPETGILRLEETREGFLLTLPLSATDSEISLATRFFAKRPLQDWWDAQRVSLAPSDLQIAGFPEVAFAPPQTQGICDEQWLDGTLAWPGVPDSRIYHTAVWTGTEMIVWGGYINGNSYCLNTGGRYNPSTDTWTRTSTGADCPTARYRHTAVWSGTEMIVWGGASEGGSGNPVNTGGRYNPSSDSWAATSTGANCPSARYAHTAVWTGTQMIVWGGTGGPTGGRYNPSLDSWLATSTGANCPTKALNTNTAVWSGTEMILWGGGDIMYWPNTGARYNPSSDTWLPTSTGANCPLGRTSHTAVWTGTEMIIWGGDHDYSLNSGGRYNPSSDSWTPTSTGANCPAGRYGHVAVWTGTEMIVWGGNYNTGGRYNPSSDSWATTSTGANCPSIRQHTTALWTGTEMIVWGGLVATGSYGNTGGRYNPVTDSWAATSTGVGPSPRQYHTAVWTGAEMIVWGGYMGSGSYYFNTGGRYNPATDAWTATSTGATCPSARNYHTAVWTGTEMIVWGGFGGTYANTGGRYNPSTDAWTATSTGATCPTARSRHSSVWTGMEMIVWGGTTSSSPINTGGRYNPSADSWAATSTGANRPDARYAHTAIWTGTEMIVWGGWGTGSTYLDTGGRYTPSADSWAPTSTLPGTCPSARVGHTAIWAESEMIVWGGYTVSTSPLNTGARYAPSSDTWLPTSIGTNCPSARYYHTAVWTGAEMIVWGGSSSGNIFNAGGLYSPYSDSWRATSTGAFCPAGRGNHCAVWTGRQMIVWGGAPAYSHGGLYSPGMATPAVLGPSPACQTASLSTGAFASYQWYRNGSIISGATGQTYNAPAPGTYAVRVMDSNGCEATSTGFVISSNPTPSITGPNEGCISVSLTTGSFASYQWRLNGSPIDGATGQSYAATQSGTYSVTVTNAVGCSGTSGGKVVTLLTITPTVTGDSFNSCPAASVTLTSSPASAYQWAFAVTPIPGATAQTYNALVSGNYSVAITDSNGCQGTSAPHPLFVDFCPTSEVSPKQAIFPLRVVKDATAPSGYWVYFQRLDSTTGFNFYAGTLGSWYSHGGMGTGRTCDAVAENLGTGEMRVDMGSFPGDRYFLITAHDTSAEGPSGFDGGDEEIDPSKSTCSP